MNLKILDTTKIKFKKTLVAYIKLKLQHSISYRENSALLKYMKFCCSVTLTYETKL
jgi:hypothetical protein